MSPNHNPSPDIYPGLDDELDAVYERNVADGIAAPVAEGEQENLETTVQEQLQQQRQNIAQPEHLRAEDLQSWAGPSLVEASTEWQKYFNAFGDPEGIPKPNNVTDELGFSNPNFYPTLERLFNAKEALKASDEVNPAGEKVGDSMRLVLMPWKEMYDGRDDFSNWVERLRGVQNLPADYFNDHIIKAIKEDQPMYRDPENPSKLLKPSEYLSQKIAKDGPWGVMLVQESQQAGVDRLKGQNPNQLTANGDSHLEIAGQTVDAMGVFEWIALTLQRDPKQLSSEDYSWLLANRLKINGVPCVPRGDWYDGQVLSYLYGADDSFGGIRPRLAVS